ncbi:hypothetical protein AB0D10_27195 [Kitasatospora sp. NPDC048545]|uniref:hypothetical protein n=1 Tax=Kitasatospora sp. NPDC048545 TaxID=3157208 RepID=UPI0033F302CC
MWRPARLVTATAVVIAAAVACTGGGAPRGERTPAPWPLDGLAAAPVDAALQGGVDVLPVKGVPAKVLGVARISGSDVVLALRDDTCHAVFLPTGATGPAAAPASASTSLSIGAQRPAAGNAASDEHGLFPGTVLAGSYTQASSPVEPFAFAHIGCSEKGMALMIEGVDESAQVRKEAGDSLGCRRSGRDVLVTVGAADAIRAVEPGTPGWASAAAFRCS